MSRKYGKYRPSDADFSSNAAKARLLYAGSAILQGVRDKNKKWTWKYFAERRDDRNCYVELFQKKLTGSLVGPVSPNLIFIMVMSHLFAVERICKVWKHWKIN